VELTELTDTSQELSAWHYQQLEAGGILFFPRTPIGLSEEQHRALLSQRQTEASYHKNIAYRPAEDVITGMARGSDREQLRRILKEYCRQTAGVIARLLPRYARSSRLDFTSFRPFQEEGRTLPLRSRKRPAAHRRVSHPSHKR
jgi:phytoene/squalene synthetase